MSTWSNYILFLWQLGMLSFFILYGLVFFNLRCLFLMSWNGIGSNLLYLTLFFVLLNFIQLMSMHTRVRLFEFSTVDLILQDYILDIICNFI